MPSEETDRLRRNLEQRLAQATQKTSQLEAEWGTVRPQLINDLAARDELNSRNRQYILPIRASVFLLVFFLVAIAANEWNLSWLAGVAAVLVAGLIELENRLRRPRRASGGSASTAGPDDSKRPDSVNALKRDEVDTSSPLVSDRHDAGGTTRLLAAATYLDEDYREEVLDSTVRDPTRFVWPDFGVDTVTVVRHALVAHRRSVIRNVLLLVDVLALLAILIWAAWGSVKSALTGSSTRTLLALLLVLLLVAVATVFVDSLVRRVTLSRYLVAGRIPHRAPRLGGRAAKLLAPLEHLPEGNLVVFASHRPFVGSGELISAGTAAVPLQGVLEDPEGLKFARDRGLRRRSPLPFSERELLDHLIRALRTLDLPGTRVQERMYVNGVDARLVFGGRLVRDGVRPSPLASREDLDAALADPLGRARHYLCAETTSRYGHLVSTTFIRVVELHEMLYVESTSYVLPPLKERFLEVDKLGDLDSGDRFKHAIGDALIRTVPLMFRCVPAVPRAISAAGRPARALRRYRAALRHHAPVNQGAYTSVRQSASASALSGHYFIDQDIRMHTEVVAARVAEGLKEFLAEQGYDIGELNVVENVVFYRHGGSVGAIGTGAQGSVTTTGGQAGTAPAAGGGTTA